MSVPLVSVRNLRVSFRLDRETTFEAVKGISFDIPRDSTVALVGESGSGKTTLGMALLALQPIASGEIEVGAVRVDNADRQVLRTMRSN